MIWISFLFFSWLHLHVVSSVHLLTPIGLGWTYFVGRHHPGCQCQAITKCSLVVIQMDHNYKVSFMNANSLQYETISPKLTLLRSNEFPDSNLKNRKVIIKMLTLGARLILFIFSQRTKTSNVVPYFNRLAQKKIWNLFFFEFF